MGHAVDGFDLKFTSRTSWKAERRRGGDSIDIVPVTWDAAWKVGPDRKEITQEVWYKDPSEMERVRQSAEPFVVALAAAVDSSIEPPKFREFKGVFEVVATGEALSRQSIATRAPRRIKAEG